MTDDILSKYLSPLPRDGVEKNTADENGAFVSMSNQVAMLDLELPGGARVAYPYATLMKIEFDPSKGITLRFAHEDVQIAGYKLHELYKGITQYRVPRVRITKNRRGFWRESNSKPVVTNIRCGSAEN